jgi:phosphate transport system permease protein
MRPFRDAATTGAAWAATAAVVGAFAWLVGSLLVNGVPTLVGSLFCCFSVGEQPLGRIGPILLSTVSIVGICALVVTPAGLATAVVLSELKTSRTARIARTSLDVLAAVPSIVFGLFGNALFCPAFGMGFSILSGGLTLAVMVLPLFARTAEHSLRAVTIETRVAARALGLGWWPMIRRVIIPAAIPGLAGGFALAVARALSETAALIFTSGYVDRWPSSVFDSGRALAVHILDLAINVPGGDKAAAASALILLALVMLTVYGGSRLWALGLARSVT